jgi:UDP-N-acetylglucosamine 2-epimerase (non-hydrolysing)
MTKPDLILVHGDTATAAAATLTAYYHQIPIGHIEAGLRSGDLHSPWPEEGNRKIIGCLGDLHFAPTKNCMKNLIGEGVPKSKIFITGNTVVDSLFITLEKIKNSVSHKAYINTSFRNISLELSTRISDWEGKTRQLILITGHRRENFGDGVLNLCSALKYLSSKYTNIDFVYPVHLNPNIQTAVKERLQGISNIYLIPPLDYLNFVYLMSLSHIILTDSGGIQEEAPSIGKPVLVMRDVTERPEGIDAGTIKLVGMKEENIINAVEELLESPESYSAMANAVNPYGNGTAGLQIAGIINKFRLGRVVYEF